MAKKLNYVHAATVAAFGVAIRKAKTLIGFEAELKGGRAAAPGGKEEPIDKGNPDIVLYRELTQEVGSCLIYRQVAQPLVFCTSVSRDHHVVIPTHGQSVDLRLFYLLEVMNDAEPEETEPGEFNRPQFVNERFFEGKAKGKDIRTAFAYALKKFHSKGLWPVLPGNMPTVSTDFDLLRQQLETIDRASHKSVGFSPAFIDRLTNHAGAESPFMVRGQLDRRIHQAQSMVA